jgi:3-oxoacyl-[acyl-carrier protein] reductase
MFPTYLHSAGIYNAGSIASMSAAALEEMFRVNVYSGFFLVRELLRAGSRNAVFIGSTAGQRGEPGQSHYAEGAVQSMMMAIAVELGCISGGALLVVPRGQMRPA